MVPPNGQGGLVAENPGRIGTEGGCLVMRLTPQESAQIAAQAAALGVSTQALAAALLDRAIQAAADRALDLDTGSPARGLPRNH